MATRPNPSDERSAQGRCGHLRRPHVRQRRPVPGNRIGAARAVAPVLSRAGAAQRLSSCGSIPRQARTGRTFTGGSSAAGVGKAHISPIQREVCVAGLSGESVLGGYEAAGSRAIL